MEAGQRNGTHAFSWGRIGSIVVTIVAGCPAFFLYFLYNNFISQNEMKILQIGAAPTP